MVEFAAERLTEHLLERIGDGLRTVVIVRDEGYDVSHLREDLERRYSEDEFAKVVDSFRLREPFFDPGIRSSPIGERRAVVHYHSNAFIIQIPFSETDSILVSVTSESGRDLLQFIEKCRQIVKEEGH